MKKNTAILLFIFSTRLWVGALLTVIILFSSIHAQCQNKFTLRERIDSLTSALNDNPKEDIQQLKILKKLVWDFNFMHLDSATYYADQALALATRLNKKEEMIDANNLKAFILNTKSQTDSARVYCNRAIELNQNPVDSNSLAFSYIIYYYSESNLGSSSRGLNFLQKAMHISSLTNDKLSSALANLGYSFYYLNYNPDSAFPYCAKAIELFSNLNDKENLSGALIVSGALFFGVSKYDSALMYMQKALEVAKKSGGNICLGSSYGELGIYWGWGKGNYPAAIENLLQSIKYCEKAENKLALAFNLNNLAWALQQAGQLDKALYYLNRQLPISKEINNLYSLAGCYEEFGNVYLKKKNFKAALNYYQQALHLSLKENMKSRFATCYRQVGDAYESLQKYDSAFYHFKKGIEVSKETSNQYELTNCFISIARTLKNMPDEFVRGEIKTILNRSDKNARAIEYAEEAVQLLHESGEPDLKANAYQVLSELYQSINNIPKAYQYYKQYVIYKDSILNTENSKSIANLQIQYETEKKEQQIALLTKDTQLQQAQIQKQKTQRNGLIGGCALVLVLAGITYNRYRVKQKANTEIEKTMQHLRDTQDKLIEREKLAHLGKLTADVARELNTPVMRIKNLNTINRKLLALVTNKHANAQNVTELKNNLQEINMMGFDADKIVKRVLKESREVAK